MNLSAEWLSIILQGAYSEIFVLDGRTFQLLQASHAACFSLQYAPKELVGMPAAAVMSLPDRSLLAAAGPGKAISFETELIRRDGSRYRNEFRLFRCDSPTENVFIAIGRDRADWSMPDDEHGLNHSLFSAIVSNTPGLVYQFQRSPDNKVSFSYLSEGCQALLGLSVEQLCAEPELFLDLILPDDRRSYLESMEDSAHDLRGWNWEGRIWIEAWKDIKWINLRATPHLLADKSVQWNGIMTNITQSKLVEFEIKHSRARLAELSAHIERVKELERTHIAREVHDDIGGNLTAIKMALTVLASRLPKASKAVIEKIAYVDLLVDRTIESARRIASDLRPSILDFGIVAAIEWQTQEFEKQIGIPCRFVTQLKEIELHPDQATAIFRIFQEALTNIAKHAGASRVTVKLRRVEDALELTIADNGKGIDNAERLKLESFGIRGMIERANSLGGKLAISQTRGGGTNVALWLPLQQTSLE